MNSFYYVGQDVFNINDNHMIKVYILDLKNKIIHNIYKTYSKELEEKLKGIKLFDNITNSISFAIKRDGKITLDIK